MSSRLLPRRPRLAQNLRRACQDPFADSRMQGPIAGTVGAVDNPERSMDAPEF